MILNLSKLFPLKTSPSQPVTVRALRNMRLTNSEGISLHVDTGEEIEITRATLAQLDQGDVQVLSSTKDEAEPVANPTPPRREIEPIPEAWKSLPECFAEYHRITEEFRVARLHIEEIRLCRVQTFGTDARLFGNKDTHTVLVNRFDWKPRENVVYHASTVDVTDPTNQKLERFIAYAEAAAADHLNRLYETKELALQRLYLECGMHRVGVSEKLAEIIAELNDIGFTMFSTRISALGLAEWHARKLYSGSADCIRFSNHAPAYEGGMRFGGMADDGSMRRYCDEPVQSSASHSLHQAARIEELEPLVAKGRAELAAARKIASKAA